MLLTLLLVPQVLVLLLPPLLLTQLSPAQNLTPDGEMPTLNLLARTASTAEGRAAGRLAVTLPADFCTGQRARVYQEKMRTRMVTTRVPCRCCAPARCPYPGTGTPGHTCTHTQRRAQEACTYSAEIILPDGLQSGQTIEIDGRSLNPEEPEPPSDSEDSADGFPQSRRPSSPPPPSAAYNPSAPPQPTAAAPLTGGLLQRTSSANLRAQLERERKQRTDKDEELRLMKKKLHESQRYIFHTDAPCVWNLKQSPAVEPLAIA